LSKLKRFSTAFYSPDVSVTTLRITKHGIEGLVASLSINDAQYK
jgi:hypothetical protein